MGKDAIKPYHGHCPICEQPTIFRAHKPPLRAHLVCLSCPGGRSVPRERALALVLAEARPNWRKLSIHESSPARRGISLKMKRECKNYVGSQYFPNRRLGEKVDGWVNQNLEQQTFQDDSFDVVVSLDVFEHVFNPAKAWAEIYRTLKPGGISIHTFPIIKEKVDPISIRATQTEDGTVTHHESPQYHGNPISGEGALVTVDYGYGIHDLIAKWVPFSVRVVRFSDKYRGIMGGHTEVVICEKRPLPYPGGCAGLRTPHRAARLRRFLSKATGAPKD